METHDYTTGIIIYIYMINQCVPCGNQMWLAGKSPLPMEVSFAGRNIDFFSGFSGKLWNDTGGESHYDPMEFHEIPWKIPQNDGKISILFYYIPWFFFIQFLWNIPPDLKNPCFGGDVSKHHLNPPLGMPTIPTSTASRFHPWPWCIFHAMFDDTGGSGIWQQFDPGRKRGWKTSKTIKNY